MRASLSILAVSLSTAFLAACAADPTPPRDAAPDAATASSGLICTKEYATGSNIATMRCRSSEEVEAEKTAATRGLGRSTGGANAKPGGS